MFVKERFYLNDRSQDHLRSLVPQFGYNGFGEFIFYRTYSRSKPDGSQESWADCVIRVINGVLSIRKDWYAKNHIAWDESWWQEYAGRMAQSLFQMEWLPPGRGLWAMGTDFVYERGSMALNNCAYTNITTIDLAHDITWMMDALMLGCGVGFGPVRDDDMELHTPEGTRDFVIPDSREGWCHSVWLLLTAYLESGRPRPRFVYDRIRAAGEPIKGFGGIASGPQPLIELHQAIEAECQKFGTRPEYDSVYFKANVANLIGCCVVAGNVRRSAELMKGKLSDPVFKDLKDYRKFPEREAWGWMSNNSVELETDEDFEALGEIAKRVIANGEPGFINRRNMPLARIGKKMKGLRRDAAVGFNPCQPAWATVLTVDGIKTLDEVQVGDRIWGETGWTTIMDKWSTGVNRVYKYATRAGVFYGTEGHRVVSEHWKVPVKDACMIDCLAGRDAYPVTFDNQDVVDGLVVGDGSYHKASKTVYLCVGKDDQSWYEQLDSYILGHFGKDWCRRVRTTIRKEELPVTYLRSVPGRFFYGTATKVCGFLRGLFSANGSICGNRITLKAASLRMIEDVQQMLSSVGIRSYYTTNKSSTVEFKNGPYRCKQSYDLNITQDRKRFAAKVGFVQPYKTSRLQQLLDRVGQNRPYKLSYEILSREFVSEEETFDITVDNATHTYWTGGCNVSNCGEQPLEHRELCTLVETLPTVCKDEIAWVDACAFATFYASTVTLLPTHQPSTNAVMARNRRIGVGIIDYTGWKHAVGVHKVIKYLRQGYRTVRATNAYFNDQAGVPHAIRVTTVKPGGTTPKLPGRTSGAGHPTFTHTLRRVRVAKNSPVHQLLTEAGVPFEQDVFDRYTDVFEWPILQGPAKPAEQVSLWEQAINIVTLQREWSDNAVSNTLYFRPKWRLIEVVTQDVHDRMTDYLGVVQGHLLCMAYPPGAPNEKEYVVPERYRFLLTRDQDGYAIQAKVYEYDVNHEEDDIEPVLSAIAPLTKSVSVLPHSPKGAYRQMPEEGISEEEYFDRLEAIRPIDWSRLSGSDGLDERYCTGGVCEVPQ